MDIRRRTVLYGRGSARTCNNFPCYRDYVISERNLVPGKTTLIPLKGINCIHHHWRWLTRVWVVLLNEANRQRIAVKLPVGCANGTDDRQDNARYPYHKHNHDPDDYDNRYQADHHVDEQGNMEIECLLGMCRYGRINVLFGYQVNN